MRLKFNLVDLSCKICEDTLLSQKFFALSTLFQQKHVAKEILQLFVSPNSDKNGAV